MDESNKPAETSIRLEDKPKRVEDYRLEQLDGELLLYHPTDTQILYLNQTASLVWGLCSGDHSVGEIIQLLSEAYPEASEDIPTDVQDTLEQFLRVGWIELK